MDARLVGWARAVKARAIKRAASGAGAPVATLWLFTDAGRLPDPLAVLHRLPRGIAGVVLRDDALPARTILARRIARLCRARGIALAVAGDWRLAAAVRAGMHLREGRRPPGAPRRLAALTSSAHGVADLVRARRAGVRLAFLSPVFATASHPGAQALGPLRWGLMVQRLGGMAAALGGLDGRRVRRLPRGTCFGAGAIEALRAGAIDAPR